MHRYFFGLLISGLTAASAFLAVQEPGENRRPAAKTSSGGGIVARMMRLDKNKDGKLQKSEVTDQRLKAPV